MRVSNGKLRDEYLNGEIFYSLKEAQIVIELWREEYNTRRTALGISSPRTNCAAPGCDVNSLTRIGTKDRSGHGLLSEQTFPGPTETVVELLAKTDLVEFLEYYTSAEDDLEHIR